MDIKDIIHFEIQTYFFYSPRYFKTNVSGGVSRKIIVAVFSLVNPLETLILSKFSVEISNGSRSNHHKP